MPCFLDEVFLTMLVIVNIVANKCYAYTNKSDCCLYVNNG